MVLTDAGVMAKARKITIAFSDGEIGDGIIARIQRRIKLPCCRSWRSMDKW